MSPENRPEHELLSEVADSLWGKQVVKDTLLDGYNAETENYMLTFAGKPKMAVRVYHIKKDSWPRITIIKPQEEGLINREVFEKVDAGMFGYTRQSLGDGFGAADVVKVKIAGKTFGLDAAHLFNPDSEAYINAGRDLSFPTVEAASYHSHKYLFFSMGLEPCNGTGCLCSWTYVFDITDLNKIAYKGWATYEMLYGDYDFDDHNKDGLLDFPVEYTIKGDTSKYPYSCRENYFNFSARGISPALTSSGDTLHMDISLTDQSPYTPFVLLNFNR